MKADNFFEYKSLNYKEFLKKFRTSDNTKHSLIVFAGPFTTNRNAALDELKREILGEAVEIDLAGVITPYEEESYKRLDECIEAIEKDAPMVVFKNAEQLNGAYTSFSESTVKYATPQEKYFLKRLKEIHAPVVLEFKDFDQLDRTVERTADAVIGFKAPSSFIEQMVWKLQNIHVHGSRFLSLRPH